MREDEVFEFNLGDPDVPCGPKLPESWEGRPLKVGFHWTLGG